MVMIHIEMSEYVCTYTYIYIYTHITSPGAKGAAEGAEASADGAAASSWIPGFRITQAFD